MKNSSTFDCEFCESRSGLREKRNCGWDQPGECSICGEINFEDVVIDHTNSKFTCPICGGRVKFGSASEFVLGNYRTPGCPKSRLTERAIFLIKLVNWSEDSGILPTASNLLDESLLYFEIRNFVVSERIEAEEQMRPKDTTSRR